jgi:glucokinase
MTPARSADGSDGDAELAIGVDIGGTKIAAGVVDCDGRVLERRVMPTPAVGGVKIVDLICTAATEFRERFAGIGAMGVGVGGWVTWPEGIVRFSPYIALKNFPLQQSLAKATGLPVVVDNDANAASWAELNFGSGKGIDNMLMLTLGTGIGGAIIINGKLHRGSNNLGAEVGHIMIDPGGEVCGCGNRGCFETRASGTALGREGRTLLRKQPEVALASIVGDPEAVTGVAITDAAKAGDQTARELLSDLGYWVGIGIASLIAVVDPELIVLAGGLADSGDLLLAPLRRSLDQHIYARGSRSAPPVVISVLGLDAGLIGAAALCLRPSSEPPYARLSTGRRAGP